MKKRTILYHGQTFTLIDENTGSDHMGILTFASEITNDYPAPQILSVVYFEFEDHERVFYCEVKFQDITLNSYVLSKIIDFYQ